VRREKREDEEKEEKIKEEKRIKGRDKRYQNRVYTQKERIREREREENLLSLSSCTISSSVRTRASKAAFTSNILNEYFDSSKEEICLFFLSRATFFALNLWQSQPARTQKRSNNLERFLPVVRGPFRLLATWWILKRERKRIKGERKRGREEEKKRRKGEARVGLENVSVLARDGKTENTRGNFGIGLFHHMGQCLEEEELT